MPELSRVTSAVTTARGWVASLRQPTPSAAGPTPVAPTGRASSQAASEARINRGLRRLNLGLRYQPVFALDTAKLDGAEALLRADSDDAVALTARAVVRMVTAQGQMPEITELVVGDAARVAALMVQAGETHFRASVNISIEQLLDPGFVAAVGRALAECEIEPRHLQLEVPEHSLVGSDRSVATVEEVARLGVAVVIDDFWAIAPELLTQLPSVTGVKVDISRTGGNERAEQELRRVVAMAAGAGLAVTAKRVETAEDLAFARSLGCAFGQGNQLSGPLSATDLLSDGPTMTASKSGAATDDESNGSAGPQRRVA